MAPSSLGTLYLFSVVNLCCRRRKWPGALALPWILLPLVASTWNGLLFWVCFEIARKDMTKSLHVSLEVVVVTWNGSLFLVLSHLCVLFLCC